MIRESVFETYGSPTSPEQKLWLDAAEREHIELEKDRLANPKSASGYRYNILTGESASHFLLNSPPALRDATAHMRPQRLAVVFFEVRSDRDTYVLTFLPLFDPPSMSLTLLPTTTSCAPKPHLFWSFISPHCMWKDVLKMRRVRFAQSSIMNRAI